ncbi:pseudouridine synthase pus4, variant 2 [Basidiobolus ranarum]|uniref:tRNA pseudouridine(55) synthase n=1 Tax=Basidiobolus ranarum TaxID=34480 RepID=A0ABR2VU53_9FUNG
MVNIFSHSHRILMDFLKVYEATGILGSATDTYDSCGQVTRVAPFEHVTSEQFEKCLEQFRGEITQIPPIYSALRMQGVRLYDYARKGLPLPAEIKARPVKIHSLESLEFTSKHSYNTTNNGIQAETSLEPCTPPIFRIRVACGGGTYIRSLIYDIGEQLDSAAHMVQLKRTEQGGFVLGKDTLELEECCDIDKIRDAINHSKTLLSQK